MEDSNNLLTAASPHGTEPAPPAWLRPEISGTGLQEPPQSQGKIYVSLTSIFDNQVRLLRTLQSILDQSRVPDLVFLYLSEEPYLKDKGFPGRVITDRSLERFLEQHRDLIRLRWVDNTGPYRKLLPLIGELADDGFIHRDVVGIITLDDDLEYHREVVSMLANSNAPVACLRGFDMKIQQTSDLLTWGYFTREPVTEGTSVFYFSTGVGGVFYRRSVFDGLLKVFLDASVYLECCPTNDDIWFNFLRIVKGVSMTVVDAPYVEQDLTNDDTSLWQSFNLGRNNLQICATAERLQQYGLL